MALYKKQEALCMELRHWNNLAYCYWGWGLLAREQRDRKTEREKLAAALDIFTELNIPRERDQCEQNWRRRQQLREPPKTGDVVRQDRLCSRAATLNGPEQTQMSTIAFDRHEAQNTGREHWHGRQHA